MYFMNDTIDVIQVICICQIEFLYIRKNNRNADGVFRRPRSILFIIFKLI